MRLIPFIGKLLPARKTNLPRATLLTATMAALCLPFSAQADTSDTFVHLFEWSWNEIAQECEFLARKGYKAVQISPPAAHIGGDQWWTRYQTLEYGRLESRSGNEQELRNMVSTCADHGVEIYVDAVFNQMAGSGNLPEFTSSEHFNNNNCNISNYGDSQNVWYCTLYGMPDLNHANPHVKSVISGYLNKFIEMGVTGFRIDAAKHMPPDHLKGIYDLLSGNPFIFQEVLDAWGESPDIHSSRYTPHAPVTNIPASLVFRQEYRSGNIANVQNRLNEISRDTSSENSVIFTDNHDSQRGHASGDDFNFRQGDSYDLANIHMLAQPYGYPKVMSSYYFNQSDDNQGPPSSNPHDTCGQENNGWVCEHRRERIANMVYFRKATAGASMANETSEGQDKIAFSRGNKGFVAINRSNNTWTKTFNTGLPSGNYCDVTRAVFDLETSYCDGNIISVDADGEAQISIPGMNASVIYVGSQICEAGENCEIPDFVNDNNTDSNSGNSGSNTGNSGGSSSSNDSVFSQMYVRGHFNGWGAQSMSYLGNDIWYSQVDFGDEGERCFKFETSGSSEWGENYGISDEFACGNGADSSQGGIASEQGGKDIPAPAGSWYVTLNERTFAYQFLTSQEIDDLKDQASSNNGSSNSGNNGSSNSGSNDVGNDQDEFEGGDNTSEGDSQAPATSTIASSGGGALYLFLCLLAGLRLVASRK